MWNPEDAVPELIVAGRLRHADGTWGAGEVWVSGEKIVAVHEAAQPVGDAFRARRIDVGEDLVLPGAIDVHVHSLATDGEGIAAATRSAAAGGMTTIIDMPFDAAGTINTSDLLLAKQELAANESVIDIGLLGALKPDGGWREAAAMATNGALGFKVSLLGGDRARFPRINFPRITDDELLDVMTAVRGCGRTLCVHAENDDVVQALLQAEAATDPTDPQAHSRTRPPVSETLGVLTALEIAADQGTALHLCHLTLPRSIDLASWYKSQGVDVTLETCPHYLTFTDRDLDVQGGRLKINPPLRDQAAQDGLWDRLLSGRVDMVSSDHAPWRIEFKEDGHILRNYSGVPGVETLVAATIGGAIRRDPSLRTLGTVVDAVTISPAVRFGLERAKGSLDVGKDADIMVVSPSSMTVDESRLHSEAGWSPYSGLALGGEVTHTISRGDVVYTKATGLSAAVGRGRVLTRTD